MGSLDATEEILDAILSLWPDEDTGQQAVRAPDLPA
jgi:hypothetical protein